MSRDIGKSILTQDSFQSFLNWLSPQETKDGDAYEKARRRLVVFFASRQCREPENLADKTIDIAILKIAKIPAEAQPIAYLLGIAKNVFRDYLRETERENTVSSAIAPQSQLNASQPDVEHHHLCLDRCLNELHSDERTVLLNYYTYAKLTKIELHRRLAEEHNLTLNALRNRIFRLNQRVGRCVDHCLENIQA